MGVLNFIFFCESVVSMLAMRLPSLVLYSLCLLPLPHTSHLTSRPLRLCGELNRYPLSYLRSNIPNKLSHPIFFNSMFLNDVVY